MARFLWRACIGCLPRASGSVSATSASLVLLLLQLSACATHEAIPRGLNPGSKHAMVLPATTDKVSTARYPGTQTPADEKSRRVAIDMVAALSHVVREADLVGEMRVARPGNSFEYNLLEQLQLAGFNLFLASVENPQSAENLQTPLSYSVELLGSGRTASLDQNNILTRGVLTADSGQGLASGRSLESFNDYAFRLQYNNFILHRQYRVSEQTVIPLTPMQLLKANGSEESTIVQTDEALFQE